jgi:hypothetical protein
MALPHQLLKGRCQMKKSMSWFCFLLGLSLLCGSSAKADYMNWSYTSTLSVPGLAVGALSPSGGATVSLTGFNNGSAGTSIPVIAYITSTSLTSPIAFDPSTAKYTLGITFTDNATHDSGTLSFTGAVGGTLSATTSTLSSSFAPSSSSLTLDGHVYSVTMPSVALAPPTSSQQSILATVRVSDVPGGGSPGQPTANTPEPGGIVLACMGITVRGAQAYLRRLRAERRQPAQG